MKIVLCQTNIKWEDKKVNIARAEKYIADMAQEETELILFPEMSFTGFSMNTEETKESDYRTVNRMKEYASQYGIAIGFGWVKDCIEKSENHYTIVDNTGKMISDYSKIHPFSYSGEDKKFRGGEDIVTFQLNGISFSTFICYDLRFPEVFQTASKTANVILMPANWPASRREHWKCLLQARAIENQVYIFAINCVGTVGNMYYSGDSCVINPDGKVIMELSAQEGIIKYELLDDVETFRNAFQVKNDRREDLYEKYVRLGKMNGE